MRHIIIPVLLGTILAAGCTTTFEPDIDTTPVIVVNVLVEPDSLICASVSRSWRLDDKPASAILTDATAQVMINGFPAGSMNYDPDTKMYISDVRAKSGDMVTVTATDARYGTGTGTTEIPVPVPVDRWDVHVSSYEDHDAILAYDQVIKYYTAVRFTYSVTFTDPADEDNYYLIGNTMTCEDPILGENESAIDGVFNQYHDFAVFSDQAIRGKEYTLTCYNYYLFRYLNPDWEPTRRYVDEIRLYSISRDYYLYLISMYKKYNGVNGTLEEFGLAEPHRIYTNISSGAGIVAARACNPVLNDVTDKLIEVNQRGY